MAGNSKKSSNTGLSNRQLLAAHLLAMGKPKTDIAKELGMGGRTLYTWLHSPHFEAAVNHHRVVILGEARDRMRSFVCDSITTLESLIKDEDSNIRLKAIGLVLDKVPLFSSEADKLIGSTDPQTLHNLQQQGPYDMGGFDAPLPPVPEDDGEESSGEEEAYSFDELLKALLDGSVSLEDAQHMTSCPGLTTDMAKELLKVN